MTVNSFHSRFLCAARLCFFSMVVGLFSFQPILEAKEPYPKTLTYSPEAFQACKQQFKSFKTKTNCKYQVEVLDTVASTVSLLLNPVRPIKLQPKSSSGDELTLILDGIKQFLARNEKLFHINEKNVVLSSVDDHGDMLGVVFERAKYLRHPSAGSTRGQIEFVVEKSTKEVHMLVSTLTPTVQSLPDSATYPKAKIKKKLNGRTIRFSIKNKHVRFNIFRDDLIQFRKVCVYERKRFKQLPALQNVPAPPQLFSSEIHLAYEIIIANTHSLPIVTYYFDAITGEELAMEAPQ